MKDKNGFLLGEETLKIIIAVICILFLVYLLVALYFSVTGAQKTKEAAMSMNLISNEAKRIDANGLYNEQGILIPNPSDWYIFSFTGNEKKPSSCVSENCVCICKNILIDNIPLIASNRQAKACDDNGACAVIVNLKEFQKIKIEKNGVWILINKINEQIEITRK